MECEPARILRIPDGITHIDEGLMTDCEILEELHLPYSLVKIGPEAFSGCENLKYVYFNSSLEEIGDYAFQGCTSLEDVDLEGSLNWIGESAFEGCSKLERLRIWDGADSKGCPYIMNICDLAFARCNNLKYIDIGKRIEDWGDAVFLSCGMESFVCPDMVKPLVYLPDGMFLNCIELKNVVLPRDLVEIGEDAFRGCISLDHVIKKDEDINTDEEWEEIDLDKFRIT